MHRLGDDVAKVVKEIKRKREKKKEKKKDSAAPAHLSAQPQGISYDPTTATTAHLSHALLPARDAAVRQG
jgi:hypothetical protein